jgi:hypothetical protein
MFCGSRRLGRRRTDGFAEAAGSAGGAPMVSII